MKRAKMNIQLVAKRQKDAEKRPYMKREYRNILVPIFVSEREEKLFENASLQSMENEKQLLSDLS